MVVSSAVDCLPKQGGLSNADRRDSRAGAQLSSSRDRRDERAAAHLPLLREIGWMHEGARTDLGPLASLLGAEPRLGFGAWAVGGAGWGDRKSTRLNSSHQITSYAVFCLKKKINC